MSSSGPLERTSSRVVRVRTATRTVSAWAGGCGVVGTSATLLRGSTLGLAARAQTAAGRRALGGAGRRRGGRRRGGRHADGAQVEHGGRDQVGHPGDDLPPCRGGRE